MIRAHLDERLAKTWLRFVE